MQEQATGTHDAMMCSPVAGSVWQPPGIQIPTVKIALIVCVNTGASARHPRCAARRHCDRKRLTARNSDTTGRDCADCVCECRSKNPAPTVPSVNKQISNEWDICNSWLFCFVDEVNVTVPQCTQSISTSVYLSETLSLLLILTC